MNYVALFLNIDGFIEKRLSLIRYICNPSSYSLPHITLRLFRDSDAKLEYLKKLKINYVDLIKPGSFNLTRGKKPPFVVYIQCGSTELESLEYKPDYPFSRLHITLYEGNNFDFARKIYASLKRVNWKFELSFNEPLSLSERKIGTKISQKGYFEQLFNEVIGYEFNNFIEKQDDSDYKIALIERIIQEIKEYKKTKPKEIRPIQAGHNKKTESAQLSPFEGIRFKENQLTLNELDSQTAPPVDKPVEDAIYVTPPEYARDMAICALETFGDSSSSDEIDFGDSAIGTGALFLALKNLVDHADSGTQNRFQIRSAIGIDVSAKMAEEAFVRHANRGLNVFYGDALLPEMNLEPDRNLMIVNPPYNRHAKIPRNYRENIRSLAEKQTGILINGDAGLHTYHLLIMDKWLAEDGVASWLLPSIFLQSRYGEAIRQYLLNNVQLTRIHLYDENMPQFSGADISTTIVTFKKSTSANHNQIKISYGDSVNEPNKTYILERQQLLDSIENWRTIIPRINRSVSYLDASSQIKFEDLFDIKRGLATGANSFFVMQRNEAKEIGIPDLALKPLLPKARYLPSLIIEADADGYPDINPQLVLIDCDLKEDIIKTRYPFFYNYLQEAKKKDGNEKAIVERTLVRSRKPWYSQEKRKPAPFLLTYMGRNKKDLPPLYFIFNKSNALALNTYILLYPTGWLEKFLKRTPSLLGKILDALNRSAEHTISQQTRIYSGGLQKLEPGELKKLPIEGMPEEILTFFRNTRNMLE